MRLQIRDTQTGAKWTWVAKTKRGFNKQQRKEIAEVRKIFEDREAGYQERRRYQSREIEKPQHCPSATTSPQQRPSMDRPSSGDPTEGSLDSGIALVPVSRSLHYSKHRQVFAVYRGANCIGTISKYQEDRYTKTPWQAFRGFGEAARLAGSFYGPTGKLDAIKAVTN